MKHLLLVAFFLLPLLGAAQTFAAPVKYSAGQRPYGLAIADFNADGYPDAVVPSFDSDAVGVFLARQDGTFAPRVNYLVTPTTGYNSQLVATGDVNKDGYPDIIATHSYNQVSVLLNRGDGTFAPFVAYPLGSIAVSAALVDINGDGYADIVTANSFYYSLTTPGTLSVLLNRGDGTFAPAVLYPVGSPGALRTATLRDVNNDGYPDVVTTFNPGDQVGVLLNSGHGTFGPTVAYAAGVTNPALVRVGDLNQDGYGDIVLTGGPRLSILLGQANGTFGAPTSFAVGTSVSEALTALTLSDLTGDGYPEILVGISDPLGRSAVGILRNQRNNTFAPATRLLGSFSVNFLETADLNQDHRPDIVSQNLGEFTLDVRLNQSVALATQPSMTPALALSLFPNPVAARATCALAGLPSAVRQLRVSLSDATGQLVQQVTLPVAAGSGQATLPLPELAPGLYLLQLTGWDAQGKLVEALPGRRVSVQ